MKAPKIKPPSYLPSISSNKIDVPYFGGTYINSTSEFVDQQNSSFDNDNMRMVEQTLQTLLKDDPGFRDDLFVDNPITGQPSCPIGFESVLLFEYNNTLYAKKKLSSGLDYELVWDGNATAIRILNEDKDVSFRIHSNYGVYWCKRDRGLPPPKDLDIALFGGIYRGLY
ncbi:hypothetical protein WR25_17647 [Diploscapter pachys]|uniref:Uncharacterized protein n=1 Tax=Diploscapter pachys TaxID=2018661 RepID=A0A2A2KWM2_9BILA|nr:hypothetical protein WR25_17647 [Diploscapter pachys]